MEAYAKLEGRVGLSDDDDTSKREFLITELPCSLGRAQSSEGGSIVIDCNDVLLSRQHVQITWSQEAGWLLVCLSKNGCTVDKKRYGRAAEINLKNGSAIRIGNARLYFTLPIVDEAIPEVPPSAGSKKRSYSDTLPETDGEEGDLIMAMPGNAFSPTGSGTTSSSSSERRAPVRGESYLAMIEAAFECADLPQDDNNSIHQTNLVEWVAKVYYSSLGEMQRQSLRKGIYNALTKHYVRVLGVDEDLGKRQKRGTIRWRKQKSY